MEACKDSGNCSYPSAAPPENDRSHSIVRCGSGTPEDLLDSLLDAYENFRMLEITGADRDLTEKEEAKLAKERDALTALCEKEAAKCSS